MHQHEPSATERPPRAVRVRARRSRDDEGGFILLETMIALTLITVVMAAASLEYVNGIVVSAHQRSVASASQVASTAMAEVRGTDPSNLLTGRNQSDVSAQRTRLLAIPKVSSWLSPDSSSQVWDAAAPASNPNDDVVRSSAVSTVVGPRTFKTEAYLECVGGTSTNATCTADANSIRAVVAVIWSDRGCPTVGCAFVTSSLVDVHANPTFDLNQQLPPAPVVLEPCTREVAIGETLPAGDSPVAVRMTVQDGKGAAPFTWSGPATGTALPTGLTLAPDGLITGTVTETAPVTRKPKIAVEDAFLRSDDAVCTWTVLARLIVKPVADQASNTGKAITAVKLGAEGGTSPYTFTVPAGSLPPGLTLATDGTITGTPTTAGTYTVRPVVTDKAGRTATTSFTWNITVPPLAVTNPGPQVATVNQPDSVRIQASGGSGTFSYAASSNLPTGLRIDAATGVISGTPTVLTGATPPTVRVTVTDTQTNSTQVVDFTFAVVGPPVVKTHPAQTTTRTGAVDLPLPADSTCPNGPCTYTATGLPKGLGIDAATGRISGTIASDSTTSSAVQITATDQSNAVARSGSFAWTINQTMTWATIPNQNSGQNADVRLDVSGYVTRGTGPYTFTATGLPDGLTMSTAGLVTGRTNTSTAASTVTVTARDSSATTPTTASTTFTWNRSSLAMPASDRTIQRNKTVDFTITPTGGTRPYTFGATAFPTGLTVSVINNGTALRVTGSTSVAVDDYDVALQVTDSAGAVVRSNFTLLVRNP